MGEQVSENKEILDVEYDDDILWSHEMLLTEEASHGGDDSPFGIILDVNENDCETISLEEAVAWIAKLDFEEFDDCDKTSNHKYCLIQPMPFQGIYSVEYVPLSTIRKNRPKGLKYNTTPKKGKSTTKSM